MRASIEICLIGLLLAVTGCPPGNGNGNGNGNGDPNTIRVQLGDAGEFDEGLAGGVQQGRFFDVRAQLPAGDRESASFALDPDDISVDFGTNGPSGESAAISLLLFVTLPDSAEPCLLVSPDFSLFNINVDSTGAISVTPDSQPVSDDNFAVVNTGTFGLCIAATADLDIALTIRAIEINFVPPGPVTAQNCADVMGLPEVQAALTDLASNGIHFGVPFGAERPDLEGRYALTQETTFDPDGTDIGNTQDGTITLTNQRANAITREGFGGSVDFF
jgi:hypothetical protein